MSRVKDDIMDDVEVIAKYIEDKGYNAKSFKLWLSDMIFNEMVYNNVKEGKK